MEIQGKDIKTIKGALYFLFAFCIVLSGLFTFSSFKQYGYSMTQPRMRVSRSASLTLSTTYQKVDFSGTSTYNLNTFQNDPTTGNPMVYWDATNKIFKFYNTTDVNYLMYFTGACSSTLLTTPVSLRYRFVIPNGTSPGVPAYFPNPDTDQYSDLGPVSYVTHRPFDQTLPANIIQVVRTNGFYLEVALSNGTLGTVTLDYAALNISSTNSLN